MYVCKLQRELTVSPNLHFCVLSVNEPENGTDRSMDGRNATYFGVERLGQSQREVDLTAIAQSERERERVQQNRRAGCFIASCMTGGGGQTEGENEAGR